MPLLMDDQCDCPIPFLWETYSPMLGRAVRLRLCCVTRLLEQAYETQLSQVWDTEPLMTWNRAKTGRPIDSWVQRRIDEKKAQGFSMQAPQEGTLEAGRLLQQLQQEMDTGGNISRISYVDRHAKRGSPLSNGHKPFFERVNKHA